MLRDKIILQLFIFADGFDYHSYIGKDFRGRNKAFSIPSGVKSHVLLSDGHLNSVGFFSSERILHHFPLSYLYFKKQLIFKLVSDKSVFEIILVSYTKNFFMGQNGQIH